MNFFDLHCDTATAAHRARKGLGEFSLPLQNPPYDRYAQAVAVFMHDNFEGDFDEYCFEVLDYAAADPLWGERFRPLPALENCGFCSADREFFEKAYRRGVRLVSLSWNADNPLCGGVKGAQTGLTEKGRQAVKNCEQLGIALDLSHCSDAAFVDFCAAATKPFIASHSNCRAICSHPRNLTDWQLKEIIGRGGLVGVNFYKAFLGGEGDIAAALCHLEHIFDLGGEKAAAMGSDYDGAEIHSELKNACGFYAAACGRFGKPLADAAFYGNAARFFADNTDFIA